MERALVSAVNCSTWRCRVAMSLCNNGEGGGGLQGAPVGMCPGGGWEIADLLCGGTVILI